MSEEKQNRSRTKVEVDEPKTLTRMIVWGGLTYLLWVWVMPWLGGELRRVDHSTPSGKVLLLLLLVGYVICATGFVFGAFKVIAGWVLLVLHTFVNFVGGHTEGKEEPIDTHDKGCAAN